MTELSIACTKSSSCYLLAPHLIIGILQQCLQTLHGFHGVGELGIGLGNGISLDEASNCLPEKFQVIERVVSLHFLVKVRIESDLLHIFGVTQLDERLTGTIVGVKHLLKNIENRVSGSVKLVVIGDVRALDLLLRGKTLSPLHELDDRLGGHASRLGGEVNSLSGALGHVSGGVSHQGHASVDATGAVVLWNGVGFHLDDLSSGDLLSSAIANGLLVLLDGRAVDDGSGADADVVVLGEDPSVEIGRDVVSDVHFGHLLVELHLLLRDLDALLEGDGEVVFSGVHGLGHARVGAVGSDDEVDVHGLGNSGGGALGVFLVVEGVAGVFVGAVVGGNVDGGDEALDGFGSVGDGAVAEELVHDFAAAHSDVFVGLEGVSDVDFDIGGGDEFHAADLAIDGTLGNVEFPNHTKGNGTTAGLGIVHLPLEQHSINSLLLGENLRGARSGRSASHDGDLVLHVEGSGGGGRGPVGDGGGLDEGGGGGGEGRDGGGEGGEGEECELHGGGWYLREGSKTNEWGERVGLGYSAPGSENCDLDGAKTDEDPGSLGRK
mmetsp:Transcript_7058/g.14178  ORF Transcript_7058/g.14178 Transcript_7058/m.14178 type:complete len:550 (-) Transcript_7058:90-1739(-)